MISSVIDVQMCRWDGLKIGGGKTSSWKFLLGRTINIFLRTWQFFAFSLTFAREEGNNSFFFYVSESRIICNRNMGHLEDIMGSA